MRISDWSSDVCSSDLLIAVREFAAGERVGYGGHFVCPERMPVGVVAVGYADGIHRAFANGTPLIVAGQRVSLAGRVSMDMITVDLRRSEEHTSELQSLMRISYAVFCLKKKLKEYID